jgi:succinyl-CoA synthetase alpha subunit
MYLILVVVQTINTWLHHKPAKTSGVVVAGELAVDLVVEVVDMEELQITAQFATEQIMCGSSN